MISLIYFTYRLGGFDLLLDSLKRQKCKDWELIIVDDCEGRNLSMLFEEEDLPLSWYGKSKEKLFKDTHWGVANAMNTGYKHSKGDILLYVHDYSWLNPNALDMWCKRYEKGDKQKLTVGIGVEYNYTGEFALNGYSIFNPPFSSFEDGRFAPYHHWVPEEFELFYTAFPREFVEKIDGFNERCDYDIASDYPHIVNQAKSLGYKLEVDPDNWVNIVNHRNWTMGNEKMWNVVKL